MASAAAAGSSAPNTELPKAFDKRIAPAVAEVVAQAAVNSGVARI